MQCKKNKFIFGETLHVSSHLDYNLYTLYINNGASSSSSIKNIYIISRLLFSTARPENRKKNLSLQLNIVALSKLSKIKSFDKATI
jgi:hypothetical protein